jgi:hypothetical protein
MKRGRELLSERLVRARCGDRLNIRTADFFAVDVASRQGARAEKIFQEPLKGPTSCQKILLPKKIAASVRRLFGAAVYS